MEIVIIFNLLLFGIITVVVWYFMQYLKPESKAQERILISVLILSILYFLYAANVHTSPHCKQINPIIDSCYSPFSYDYIEPLVVFHILSLISLMTIYFKGIELSPIVISSCIGFVSIGVILNCQFLFQVSSHDMSRIREWHNTVPIIFFFASYPVTLIGVSVILIVRLIKQKSDISREVIYKNSILRALNNILVNSRNLPLFSILLSIPFFIVVILILILFGQESDSLLKVYTDTATWKFSKEIHPPIIEQEHGHYLCTVAAMGSPAIVNPLGIGTRRSESIIVNRQLQIANAFEFMIEEFLPKTHRVIRTNYDRHGLNLSKRINNDWLSNLTYILMKPMEWFFLFALYTYYLNPEKIINEQYKYVYRND